MKEELKLTNAQTNSRIASAAMLVGGLILFGSGPARADDAEKPVREVAGRTLQQHAERLDDSERTVRLRALRSLAPFGAPAADAIARCLGHEDAAMRYVAAVSLGDLGSDAVSKSKSGLERLIGDERSLAVQTAAAYALCQSDREEDLQKYLPVLIEGLNHPERGMACGTAELIGKLGPKAVAAASELEKVYASNRPGGKGDYHIGGAAKNALRKLGAIN